MQMHAEILKRCGYSFLREHLEPYRLMPLDSVVLHTLKSTPPYNQETLCCIVDVDKGRMARILDHLESLNFIRRGVNPSNKREKLVELTREGFQMIDTLDSIFNEWNEWCFTGFTEEERQSYHSFLERIAKNAMAWKESLKHD